MSECMPDRMANRMSECIAGRMPEYVENVKWQMERQIECQNIYQIELQYMAESLSECMPAR